MTDAKGAVAPKIKNPLDKVEGEVYNNSIAERKRCRCEISERGMVL